MSCTAKLFLAALTLTLFIATPFVGCTLYHNWQFAKVQRSIDAIAHPPNSKRIRRVQDVGKLIGNGDGCDFFVGELRSYRGSKDAVVRAYRDAKVWQPPGDVFTRKVELVFLAGRPYPSIPTSDREHLPYDFREAADWGAPRRTEEDLYLVYFFPGGYDALMDGRCW